MTDTADLIRRLRIWEQNRRDVRPIAGSTALPDILAEAAEALTTLQSQVSLARRAAIEEVCAAISEQIGTQRVVAKAIKDREEKQIENARIVGMGDALIIARSIPAELDVDAMVEKWARIMWIDTSDKDYWDHLDDVTRNIYRSNARAILTELLG